MFMRNATDVKWHVSVHMGTWCERERLQHGDKTERTQQRQAEHKGGPNVRPMKQSHRIWVWLHNGSSITALFQASYLHLATSDKSGFLSEILNGFIFILVHAIFFTIVFCKNVPKLAPCRKHSQVITTEGCSPSLVIFEHYWNSTEQWVSLGVLQLFTHTSNFWNVCLSCSELITDSHDTHTAPLHKKHRSFKAL